VLDKLTRISRERGLRILVRTARCRGTLIIDREVKAGDETGNPVPWSKAFPGITPGNVLAQCGVSKVEVYCGSTLIATFTNVAELLSSAVRCT